MFLWKEACKEEHNPVKQHTGAQDPLLRALKFVRIAMAGKPFYIDDGCLAREPALRVLAFGGVFVLTSVDGVDVGVFGYIGDAYAAFCAHIFIGMRLFQTAYCGTLEAGEEAEDGDHQIP